MSNSSDLPEGVINADPPGGFESGDVADSETAERSAGAMGSPSLTDSGLPPNTPDGTDATADGTVEGPGPSQGADPDMATDEESEQS